MTKILAFLAASTALTAAIGVPAWSAMQTRIDDGARPHAVQFQEEGPAAPLLLASSDDDDDRRDWRRKMRRGHDDDGDDDDDRYDDDHDDDDDDYGDRANVRNPAPVGTATPPRNGLFVDGAVPKAKVN